MVFVGVSACLAFACGVITLFLEQKPKYKRIMIFVSILMTAFTIFLAIVSFLLAKPTVYPADNENIHPGPVEIWMTPTSYHSGTSGLWQIYYTTNGRDPASKDTSPDDIHCYNESFYIDSSTHFTMRSKFLGLFWGEVSTGYIMVGDGPFIPPEGLDISGPDEIDVGGWGILKAAITPDNTSDHVVLWESLTPKIASVNNNGIVTGKKAGIAEIRAVTNSGEIEKRKRIKVVEVQMPTPTPTPPTPTPPTPTPPTPTPPTPTPPTPTPPTPTPLTPTPPTPTPPTPTPPTPTPLTPTPPTPTPPQYVPVSSVSINGEGDIWLEVGGRLWLDASYEPYNATDPRTEWTTDDPRVAQIINGSQLWGVDEGTTYVNVNIGGEYDYRRVHVTQPYIPTIVPIRNVYFDEVDIYLNAYGDGKWAGLIVEPYNADIVDIEWHTDDPDIAYVNETTEEIIPGKPGQTTISASVLGADDTGYTVSAYVYVEDNVGNRNEYQTTEPFVGMYDTSEYEVYMWDTLPVRFDLGVPEDEMYLSVNWSSISGNSIILLGGIGTSRLYSLSYGQTDIEIYLCPDELGLGPGTYDFNATLCRMEGGEVVKYFTDGSTGFTVTVTE